MVGEQLKRDDCQHTLQCINCPRNLSEKTKYILVSAGIRSMLREVYEVTSRLCSAHLHVSVSPSSTIRMGLPSRAVTLKIDWIQYWKWNQMLWLKHWFGNKWIDCWCFATHPTCWRAFMHFVKTWSRMMHIMIGTWRYADFNIKDLEMIKD